MMMLPKEGIKPYHSFYFLFYFKGIPLNFIHQIVFQKSLVIMALF